MNELSPLQTWHLGASAIQAPGSNLAALQIPTVGRLSLSNVPKAVALDFDGTVLESECLHIATFLCAVSKLLGKPIWDSRLDNENLDPSPELEASHPACRLWSEFRRGFGKPERGTCLTMAEALRRVIGADQFEQRFVPVRPDQTPLERAADEILRARSETFAYFLEHSTLGRAVDGRGRERDQLIFTRQSYDSRSGLSPEQWELRDEVLCRINVRLCPNMREFLRAVSAESVAIGSRSQAPYIGVCTSSSRGFVRPLIEKFELSRYFRRPDRPEELFEIYCNDIADGFHKPYQLPWRKLLRQFNECAQALEGKTRDFKAYVRHSDVLALENTAGGFVSALLAGVNVAGAPSIDVRDGLQDHKFAKEAARIAQGARAFRPSDRVELRDLRSRQRALEESREILRGQNKPVTQIDAALSEVQTRRAELFAALRAFSNARRLARLFAPVPDPEPADSRPPTEACIVSDWSALAFAAR